MADEDWATLIQQQEDELRKQVKALNVTEEKPAQSDTKQVENPTPNPSNTNKDGAEPSKEPQSNEQDAELSAAEKSLMTKVLRDHLINVKSDVEVLQKDPNSPLYSVKSFEELNLKEDLLKGVYEMGFNRPSKIQESALPMCLADPPSNMIAQSQSGTGKTAAFVLSMLSRVDASKPYPQALCLSPTYELALQTGSVAEKMGRYLIDKGMKIAYAVRGEMPAKGSKINDHIIIGTPGTLLEWTLKRRCFDPKKIVIYVLDEADVMISTQGHQDQCIRIKRCLAPNCQYLFFSATYDEHVMNFAKSIVSDPIIIRLRREEESLDNIKQFYIMCENQQKKYEALANLYAALTIGQSMVFCYTRKNANWLSGKMVKDGHAVALLTGELEINQRLSILNRFREGKEKVLITTNVMARGIDVDQVTIVVNYDIPIDQSGRADFETYLHRIGRTGRFGKTGLAINFCDGHRSVNMVKRIEQHFGKPIELLCIDDVDELEKLQNLAK